MSENKDPQKSAHTPTPWKVSGRFDIYEDKQTPGVGGTFIGSTRGNWPLPESVNIRCQADAERIIACVNACAGIEDVSEIRDAIDALDKLIVIHPNDVLYDSATWMKLNMALKRIKGQTE